MSEEMRKLLDSISPLYNEVSEDVGSAEGQEMIMNLETIDELVDELRYLVDNLPDHSVEKMEGEKEVGNLRMAVDHATTYAKGLL